MKHENPDDILQHSTFDPHPMFRRLFDALAYPLAEVGIALATALPEQDELELFRHKLSKRIRQGFRIPENLIPDYKADLARGVGCVFRWQDKIDPEGTWRTIQCVSFIPPHSTRPTAKFIYTRPRWNKKEWSQSISYVDAVNELSAAYLNHKNNLQ